MSNHEPKPLTLIKIFQSASLYGLLFLWRFLSIFCLLTILRYSLSMSGLPLHVRVRVHVCMCVEHMAGWQHMTMMAESPCFPCRFCCLPACLPEGGCPRAASRVGAD